jgi:hypothetical protein
MFRLLTQMASRRREFSTSSAYSKRRASFLKSARSVLLKAATHRRTITYGALMRRFGLSRGRPLTATISAVDLQEHAIKAPGFAAIVVRKDTGYPGGGYFCDSTLPSRLRRPKSRSGDPRLSPTERSHIRRKQEEIWSYYSRAKHSSRR